MSNILLYNETNPYGPGRNKALAGRTRGNMHGSNMEGYR